jgi:hypothetical protein
MNQKTVTLDAKAQGRRQPSKLVPQHLRVSVRLLFFDADPVGIYRLALILAVLSLVLAGCSLQRDRTFKISEDWSRGILIGEASIRQPVGLASDEQGAYVLWASRQEEGTRLSYVRLTRDGTIVSSHVLPLETFFPRLPQLVANENLHLFLITRIAAGEEDGVYHVQLSRDGQVIGEPERLSAAEQESEALSIVQSQDGSIHVIWDVSAGPSPGIYYAQLESDGQLAGFPQLIGPNGLQPAGQVDEAGVLHVAWLEQRQPGSHTLYYATVAPNAVTSGEPTVVGDIRIPVTDVTHPLTVALDQNHVYVMWSQEHRTGLQSGTGELFFVTFPKDAPTPNPARNALVSAQASPTYSATADYPPLTAVVNPSNAVDWTSFIEGPQAISFPDSEATFVLADMNFDFRFDPRPQLVLLIFQGGEMVGHHQPARTRQYSLYARGAASTDGQLHAAWIDLEQPGHYSVYYASTRPEAQAMLNQRTSTDNLLDGLEIVWGMASGISLIPLVGIILIPVLILCGLFYITGTDDALKTSWAAQLTLAVTIITYLGAKILVMAGIVTRPPLLESVPSNLQGAWVWIALLIVAALAGLVVAIYVRRSERPYLFRAALTFALVDAFLTLILYGPAFYSE